VATRPPPRATLSAPIVMMRPRFCGTIRLTASWMQKKVLDIDGQHAVHCPRHRGERS
jgi:hypothetical protein